MFLHACPEQTEAERSESRRPLRPRPGPVEILRFGERYADVRDRRLADTLMVEDAAEENEELPALERTSCHVHRRWAHECVGSPVHVIVVTGHRWCRNCEAEASVAVDEVSGSVEVICTRCRKTPDTAATRQIIRTCQASLAAALESRRCHEEWHGSAA